MRRMAKEKDPQEQKQKALDTAVSQIEKQYGKGSIMRLGEEKILDIEGISSSSLALDLALGGRGFPRGRVAEVSAWTSRTCSSRSRTPASRRSRSASS